MMALAGRLLQPKRFDLESRGSSATGGKDLYVRLRKAGKH